MCAPWKRKKARSCLKFQRIKGEYTISASKKERAYRKSFNNTRFSLITQGRRAMPIKGKIAEIFDSRASPMNTPAGRKYFGSLKYAW
jgi:hypothetical protein